MKSHRQRQTVEVDDQTTVAALLERLGFPEKGIAVAVDWTVLPRSDWQHRRFPTAPGWKW